MVFCFAFKMLLFDAVVDDEIHYDVAINTTSTTVAVIDILLCGHIVIGSILHCFC